jgi:hypothetical protein
MSGVEIGSGIEIGTGIVIGLTAITSTDFITEDSNDLVSELDQNFIEE